MWTPDNPTKGQCGVTAIVLFQVFGGDILKTVVDGQWHYYNRINGVRYDFTVDQFPEHPQYTDNPSSEAEALTDTNARQVNYRITRFREEMSNMDSAKPV